MTIPSAPTPEGAARVIRRLLIFFFVLGSLAYSLSLIEYGAFRLTGKAWLGVHQSFDTLSEEQLKQQFLTCGTHLLGAGGVVHQAGEPMVARCGRFWPFYRYSIQLPAHPMIPGALIAYAEEPAAIRDARTRLIDNVRLLSAAWMGLSVLVIGLAATAGWQLIARRDEDKAYRWAFQAFASSVLMVLAYVGLMFWIDPHFGLGW